MTMVKMGAEQGQDCQDSVLVWSACGGRLDAHLQGTGVEAFAAHPGLTQTPKVVKEYSPKVLAVYPLAISTLLWGQSPWRASLCLERPATDPIVAGKATTV